jgi:hypothetical protein
MIIAICKERAFTGAIISTVAKHNRKIYPQALVATEQLIFLEASRISSYQQTGTGQLGRFGRRSGGRTG